MFPVFRGVATDRWIRPPAFLSRGGELVARLTCRPPERMINGVSGPVILDIGGMAGARVAVDRLLAVAGLLLLIEAILIGGIFPDARLNLGRTAAASIVCFFMGAKWYSSGRVLCGFAGKSGEHTDLWR